MTRVYCVLFLERYFYLVRAHAYINAYWATRVGHVNCAYLARDFSKNQRWTPETNRISIHTLVRSMNVSAMIALTVTVVLVVFVTTALGCVSVLFETRALMCVCRSDDVSIQNCDGRRWISKTTRDYLCNFTGMGVLFFISTRRIFYFKNST